MRIVAFVKKNRRINFWKASKNIWKNIKKDVKRSVWCSATLWIQLTCIDQFPKHQTPLLLLKVTLACIHPQINSSSCHRPLLERCSLAICWTRFWGMSLVWFLRFLKLLTVVKFPSTSISTKTNKLLVFIAQTEATPPAPAVDLNAVNAIINNLLSTGNQELIAKLSGATDTQQVVDTVLSHFESSGPSTFDINSQQSMVVVPNASEEELKTDEQVKETAGGLFKLM